MENNLNCSSPASQLTTSRNTGMPVDSRQETTQQQPQGLSNQQSRTYTELSGMEYPQSSSNCKLSDPQASPSGSTMQSSRESINLLESAMVYNMDLEQALYSLGFSPQTLIKLDESLARVRHLGYSEEAIKEYDLSFKKIFTDQYWRLAQKFCPRTAIDVKEDREMKNLTGIKEIMNALYETSKKEKNIFRYRPFAKVAFNFLHQNRNKCSSFINGNVVAELRNITIWRQSNLLYCRNEFLEKVQKLFEDYGKKTSKELKQSFNKLVNDYTRHYHELWVNNLTSLKCRCNKDLEVIKDEVERLLKGSFEQLVLLYNSLLTEKKTSKEIKGKVQKSFQSIKVTPDKCFILPVLLYKNVMKQLLNSYYGEGEVPSSDMPYFTGIFEGKAEERGSAESSIKSYISRCSFAELQELCKGENIQNNPRIIGFILNNSAYYHTKFLKRPATEEEMKLVVLVQVLNKYIDRLKEEFKKEKTWFKRMEEEIQQIQEHIQETDEKIEQEVQKAEHEAQKAEQEAQRADKLELEKTVMKLFRKSFRELRFDDELRYIVEDSEDNIVEEIVQHVMRYNFSAEQILNAIIERVRLDRDQIKMRGAIDVAMIKDVIESFSAAAGKQIEPSKNTNVEKAHELEREVKIFLDQENAAGLSSIISFLDSRPDDQQVEFLKHVDFRQHLIQFIKARADNSSRVEDVLEEKAKKELEAILADIFSGYQEQASLYSQENSQEIVKFLEEKGASEVDIDSINQVDNGSRIFDDQQLPLGFSKRFLSGNSSVSESQSSDKVEVTRAEIKKMAEYLGKPGVLDFQAEEEKNKCTSCLAQVVSQSTGKSMKNYHHSVFRNEKDGFVIAPLVEVKGELRFLEKGDKEKINRIDKIIGNVKGKTKILSTYGGPVYAFSSKQIALLLSKIAESPAIFDKESQLTKFSVPIKEHGVVRQMIITVKENIVQATNQCCSDYSPSSFLTEINRQSLQENIQSCTAK